MTRLGRRRTLSPRPQVGETRRYPGPHRAAEQQRGEVVLRLGAVQLATEGGTAPMCGARCRGMGAARRGLGWLGVTSLGLASAATDSSSASILSRTRPINIGCILRCANFCLYLVQLPPAMNLLIGDFDMSTTTIEKLSFVLAVAMALGPLAALTLGGLSA